MKVIYAGYPKTGTQSMVKVFNILGYKGVYDALDNFDRHYDDWKKIFSGKGSVDDFRRMFKDVDFVMDSPCCYFWEEILEAFPEAKVIFGSRDDEEWFQSYKREVETYNRIDMKMQALFSPTFQKMARFYIGIQTLYFGVGKSSGPFGRLILNEMMLRKSFRMHNTYVLKNAPKDKLHVVDFEKGWSPICEFLAVPVPNQPFPHWKKATFTQDSIDNHHLFRRIRIECIFSISLLVCLVAFAVFFIFSDL